MGCSGLKIIYSESSFCNLIGLYPPIVFGGYAPCTVPGLSVLNADIIERMEKGDKDFILDLFSILSKKSYQNFTKTDIEDFASLAVGKMRVIQKQVFLEYPLIEKKFSEYMEGYKIKIVDKFRKLQDNGDIIPDISPDNIYNFFRIMRGNWA